MQKIKQFLGSEQGKDFLIVLIVILVGLASFELGRLSKSSSEGGIKIEYGKGAMDGEASALFGLEKAQNAKEGLLKSTNGKNFFASSRGSKYYPVGCSAGNNLKQENRIYFATKDEAEGAGYELSSSCR